MSPQLLLCPGQLSLCQGPGPRPREGSSGGPPICRGCHSGCGGQAKGARGSQTKLLPEVSMKVGSRDNGTAKPADASAREDGPQAPRPPPLLGLLPAKRRYGCGRGEMSPQRQQGPGEEPPLLREKGQENPPTHSPQPQAQAHAHSPTLPHSAPSLQHQRGLWPSLQRTEELQRPKLHVRQSPCRKANTRENPGSLREGARTGLVRSGASSFAAKGHLCPRLSGRFCTA